jgi:hypothetical protein
MNKKWSVVLPLAAFALSAIYLVARPAPKLPPDAANGTYANDCCGTVTLRDGTMWFQNHQVAYAIETDKGGAYVLPQAYVGVEPGQGLQIERNRNVLSLRLDDEKHPESISVWGRDKVYRFTR